MDRCIKRKLKEFRQIGEKETPTWVINYRIDIGEYAKIIISSQHKPTMIITNLLNPPY